MPDGWGYVSALPVASSSSNRVDFNTVTLETLIDSPTDIGRYVKHYTLYTTPDGAKMYLDLFADKPQDLEIKDALINEYKRLAPEAIALYGWAPLERLSCGAYAQ